MTDDRVNNKRVRPGNSNSRGCALFVLYFILCFFHKGVSKTIQSLSVMRSCYGPGRAVEEVGSDSESFLWAVKASRRYRRKAAPAGTPQQVKLGRKIRLLHSPLGFWLSACASHWLNPYRCHREREPGKCGSL